jgi:eukaryotic-like serine/threonine-protein kinase
MMPRSLTPADWAIVTEAFATIHEAPVHEREHRLAALAVQHPQIVDEVRSLLAHASAAESSSSGFLDRLATPAIGGFGTHTSPMVGRRIGAYTIVREIGRGGMGVVYEGAREGAEFAQRVAIKTLPIGRERPELLWRFRRERQILARLSHPNITQLFDGGTTDDGVPYLVMELVDGVRIDSWCDEHRVSLRARLDLFRTVCQAVQHAHAQLIVHRDLKPSNILVTRAGVVKLLDFGVAKLLEGDEPGEETTRTGMLPLTTAYASPEQVRGEALSTSTDVYALGVVLYRLLTGTAPYQLDGKSAAESLQVVSTETPMAPSACATDLQAERVGAPNARSLRNLLAGELDAIVLMALRKEAARRYTTVEALSEDVHRFLRGQPVQARAERLSYTMQAFVRRNRALSGAVALAAVAMVGGTVAALWQARHAREEAQRAIRVKTMFSGVLGATDPFSYNGLRAGGADVTLRQVLDSARSRVASTLPDDPRTRADLYRDFGNSYRSLDQLELAAHLLDSARTLHLATTGAMSTDVAIDDLSRAALFTARGEADRARNVLDSVRVTLATRPAQWDSVGPLVLLGLSQVQQEFFHASSVAESLATEAIRLETKRREPSASLIGAAEGVLAVAASQQGRVARSDSMVRLALEHAASDSLRNPAGWVYASAYAGFALYLRQQVAAAEPIWRQTRATATRVFGASHPITAEIQSGLSWTLLGGGKIAEGRALADSALQVHLQRAHRNAGLISGLYRLQMSYAMALGDTAAAETARAAAAAQLPRTGGQRPILEAYLLFASAALDMQRRDTTAAQRHLDDAVTVTRSGMGAGHQLTQLAVARQAEFRERIARARSGVRPVIPAPASR